MTSHASHRLMRKTRIVCISDTHGQTPKLPKGDVLIHAGDLTNQGSFSELQKTAEWLEKADYEAKIVIAGNHDLTLDAPFFEEHGKSWRWPRPQNPEECRRLFKESKSITYLEHDAATIYLHAPNGPHTCFKVFGSPYTPKKWNWAFQYEHDEASRLFDAIPSDADIVVTHTPPKGHCDAAVKDDRSGCPVLLEALHRVRPMLSIFGHIHEARGVERVRWNTSEPPNGSLVEHVEKWRDPGMGSNKQSLVNLSLKGGRPLSNCSRLTRQAEMPALLNPSVDKVGGQAGADSVSQPSLLNSTSCLDGVAGSEAKGRAKAMLGGALEHRQGAALSDIGLEMGLGPVAGAAIDVEAGEHSETVMINAAFLGMRQKGKPKAFNKAIVVDVDLPVWRFENNAE